MHQPAASRQPDEPALLCPAAVTDPSLMGGVLAVLSDQDLLEVSLLVNQHVKRRRQAAILAELRALIAQDLEDGETESAAPVARVRIHVRQYGGMPPYWSASNLTLQHTDGVSTFCVDATHTALEGLLNDLTCVDQPGPGDVLTVDLTTGGFDR